MDREFLIGVEVNSKNITAGLVDLSGKIVKKITLPSELSKGKKKVVDNIALAINRVQKNKILGVGISLPGVINREKGVVVESPFPGWDGLPLKKMIEEQVHCPVFIENEGKCFAIAEYKCGTYRKAENVISVLFNENISSGLIIDGKIAKGLNCAAGSLAHSIVDNKKGRLVEFASIDAIEKLFKAKTRKAKPISEIVASENDKSAKEILSTAGNQFGTAISHLVNALNPEFLIVGGALANSEVFMGAVEKTIQAKTNELCGKNVKIISSKLNDSTILGASSIII
jgi:predicted NBD/HSP70 family sugar kinase